MDPGRGFDFQALQTFNPAVKYGIEHLPPALKSTSEESYDNVFSEESCDAQVKYLSADVEAKDKKVKRRSSRFGLAGLFGRTRPSSSEERQEDLGVPWEVDEDRKASVGEGHDIFAVLGNVSPQEDINALPPIEPSASPYDHGDSKRASRVKQSFKKETSIKESNIWDPPPLFQAYPQAVKHATLRALSLSAEAILRLHANRRASVNDQFGSYTEEHISSKSQKEKRLKRHTALEILSKGEWTQKIFILVTSGYLLQYTGEGNFDRLPEKLMPLTPESAAFASDAIPGQPYVLQVSQVCDDQGTLDKEASKSMLKKLGLRNEMRRSTSTFLLVLESADEMSAWLAVVRKEIHVIGGREYKADEFESSEIQQPVRSLQQKPSQRYLIKRDPNQFAYKAGDSRSRSIVDKDDGVEEDTTKVITIPIPPTNNRLSLATQSSTVSSSVSNSTNRSHLDRLRESPRESYTSSNAHSVPSSRASSPDPYTDTTQTELSLPDLTCAFAKNHAKHGQIPKATVSDQRSLSYTDNPSLHQPAAQNSEQIWTLSPTAPNFSVPRFSQRYSTVSAASKLPSSAPNTDAPHAVAHVNESYDLTTIQTQSLKDPKIKLDRKVREVNDDAAYTAPRSLASKDSIASSDNDERFSRRLSSLQYSKDIASSQFKSLTPPPHPPPTAALPALLKVKSTYRHSLFPPPTSALPPIPIAQKLPHRYSMLSSPPTSPLPPLPVARPSSSPTEQQTAPKAIPVNSEGAALPHMACTNMSMAGHSSKPPKDSLKQHSIRQTSDDVESKRSASNAKKSPHPTHIKLPHDAIPEETPPRTPYACAFEAEGLTPPFDSPPKPTRAPPPPPPPPPPAPSTPQPPSMHQTLPRKSPRIGREPPPVPSPAVTSPKPRISVSSRAEGYFDGAAPHPFIPPIRVSERKFRGSFDGPWNSGYEGPQRWFGD
ncbi:hypothetical protein ACLMJK_001759 [Lecanora helva]